jgi:type II secretory pathway component HofQ
MRSLLVAALLVTQTIALYRAQHRPASELLGIAETALGADGQVTLDARTATLVLNGAPKAVERALALLRELDRPLATVVLTHVVGESTDLDALGVAVDWRASFGPLTVGTLPLPADGVRIALAGRRESSQIRSTSVLRLLEGGTGLITTGESFPVLYQPYWGTTAVTFVPAESGFEAAATVLGDGNVRLDLRPFSGRVERGEGLRYTATATSLTVAPGETVVVGEVSREGERSSVELASGSRSRSSEERVLLISVEVEK